MVYSFSFKGNTEKTRKTHSRNSWKCSYGCEEKYYWDLVAIGNRIVSVHCCCYIWCCAIFSLFEM